MKKLNVIYSFFFYALGLGSLLVTDLLISKYFSKEEIANWGFYKSATLLISSIALLGYDQVFIREKYFIKTAFPKFKKTAFAITLVAIIVIFIFRKNIQEAVILFFTTLLLAFLNYFSFATRALSKLISSQLYNNFWKFLVLIFLLLYLFLGFNHFPFIYFLLGSVLISFIIATIAKDYFPGEEDKKKLDETELQKIGYVFLLFNLTMFFANYGEQFVINLLGAPEVAATLFTYFSVFTPIALSINGFLGFYLAPKIKNENNLTAKSYNSQTVKIFLFSIVMTAVSIIAGIVYMIFIGDRNLNELNWGLIASLALLCIVRGTYISTSVALGIFGSLKTLEKLSIKMIFITLMYILAIVFSLVYLKNYNLVIIISLLSTLNWGARFIIFHRLTQKILN